MRIMLNQVTGHEQFSYRGFFIAQAEGTDIGKRQVPTIEYGEFQFGVKRS
jgi:hypothetical protein